METARRRGRVAVLRLLTSSEVELMETWKGTFVIYGKLFF